MERPDRPEQFVTVEDNEAPVLYGEVEDMAGTGTAFGDCAGIETYAELASFEGEVFSDSVELSWETTGSGDCRSASTFGTTDSSS